MDGQKEKDCACCAHTQVIPMRIESGGRVFEEQWRCKDCGAKFVMLDSLFAGPPVWGVGRASFIATVLKTVVLQRWGTVR